MNIKNLQLGLILTTFLFSFASSNAISEEQEWQLKKEKHGVSVYTKPQEGSDYDLIRATTTIAASPEKLLKLIMDPAKIPQWNAICKKAEWLKQDSDTSGEVYYQYDMPWPLSDRDLIMARKATTEDGKTVISGEVVISDTKRSKDYIRVEQSTEYWELIPRADHTTSVSMTAFMDPNGPIPASLVNSLSTDKPIEALTKLRKMAEAKK